MGRGKRTRLVLVGVAAVATAALAFVTTGASATGPLAGKKVGVIICTEQNPFCAAWAKTVTARLEKQGASVTVLTSVFDPPVDAQNMNRLIADKPDLIISVPASASAIVPSLHPGEGGGHPGPRRDRPLSPRPARSSSPPRRARTTRRSAGSRR